MQQLHDNLLPHPPSSPPARLTSAPPPHPDPHRFAAQCDTDECVEAHTTVDVVVDIPELRALLRDRLPRVWAGERVAGAKLPWPGWSLEGGGGAAKPPLPPGAPRKKK